MAPYVTVHVDIQTSSEDIKYMKFFVPNTECHKVWGDREWLL